MTALVVDDDVCVRAILVDLLVDEGFDVSQASNGFSGLLRAAETRPQLILLDLTLPEVSGLEVLRELREKQGMRETAIVIVTANPDQLSEVLMRSGNQPNVDLTVSDVSQTAKTLLFENFQQLRLNLKVHVADFVQKDSTAMSHFKQSLLGSGCACKRAFLVAEEFGFEKLPR